MDNVYYFYVKIKINDKSMSVKTKNAIIKKYPIAKFFPKKGVVQSFGWHENVLNFDKSKEENKIKEGLKDIDGLILEDILIIPEFRGALPKYLYQYTSWKNNYTKKNIESSQLYFSHPDDFNDPFDCNMQIYGNDSTNEFKDNVGICCMSEKENNILMWAHYGDKHSGVCLKYDAMKLQSSLGSDLRKPVDLLKVQYLEKSVPIFDESMKNVPFFSFKYSAWSYEQEYRFIRGDLRKQTVKYCPNALRAIILGAKMDDKTIGELKNFVLCLNKRRNGPLELYQAKICEGKYELANKKIV